MSAVLLRNMGQMQKPLHLSNKWRGFVIVVKEKTD